MWLSSMLTMSLTKPLTKSMTDKVADRQGRWQTRWQSQCRSPTWLVYILPAYLLNKSLHLFFSDSQIIENVHSILATAASKLNLELYEHLTTLIKKKWEISEGRVREKLLRLIGLIGREAKSSKSIEATLAVLWEVVSRLCFNFWNYPSLYLKERIFVYLRIKKNLQKPR